MISLGSNAVGIGLVVKLRDQFSANANRISNQFEKMYGNANRALKQNLVAANHISAGMALAGTAGVLAFSNAVHAAADFNYTLSGVQAATNATTAELKALHDQSIQVAMQSRYTAIEVASAMEYASKAGFSVSDIQKSIKGIVELGAAADMAVGGKEGAAGTMVNILNTWGYAASKASMVADVMARASVKSSIDISDLSESIKYAGSVATTLKMPFEEVTSMIAVLGNAGMRGSMAGVGLSNMLMYLAKAVGQFRTKRQTDALTALGINPKQLLDATGNLKPMIEILDVFRGSMSKMKAPQQVSILEGLMNIRGGRAFVPLFRETEIGMNFAEMLNDIRTNSAGASAAMSKIRMDTMKGDMMVLADTWHAFKIEIGETLEPLVRMGLKFVTLVVTKLIAFARTPLGRPIVILTAALSAAVMIGGALIFAFTTLKLLTIASTVSFANMGRSLVWAWNSGTAAALRYAAVAKGVTYTSAGGAFVQVGKKGFQKAATTGAAGVGIWQTIKTTIGKFIGNVMSATGAIGWLSKALKVVSGPIGWMVALVGYLMGFKNIIKLVIWGLGSLLQGIMFVVDYVSNFWSEGPIDAYTIAKENFKKRNALLNKALGWEYGDGLLNQDPKKGQAKRYVGGEAARAKLEADGKRFMEIRLKAEVKLDSTKIGEIILNNKLAQDLQEALKVKSN